MPSDTALRSVRRWQALQTAFLAVGVFLVAESSDVYLGADDSGVARLFVDLAPAVAVWCVCYAVVLTLLALGSGRERTSHADGTGGDA